MAESRETASELEGSKDGDGGETRPVGMRRVMVNNASETRARSIIRRRWRRRSGLRGRGRRRHDVARCVSQSIDSLRAVNGSGRVDPEGEVREESRGRA